jgi:hypothetical protein
MKSIQPQVISLEINSEKDNSHKEPNNNAHTPIIMPISINNYDSFNNQNNEQKKPKKINQQISKIKFEIINEPLNTNSGNRIFNENEDKKKECYCLNYYNEPLNTNSENRLLNENEVSNKELNNNSKKIKKNKNKFKICHFEYKKTQTDENDEIISNRLKHKRKYKPDDIRKKIKARFHKSIKNIINENLRKAGSKKLFTFLPQAFISSIARQTNRYVLNMSFREILQQNFVNDLDEKKYKNKKIDLAKYKKNLSVLEYLDNNPEISKNSGFDIISEMKYCDLLEEYFKSNEFERAIFKLKEENEDEEYIKEYIIKSKNYLKFFMENDKLKIKEEEKKNLEEEEKNKIQNE